MRRREMSKQTEQDIAKQGRQAAIVIVVSGLLTILAPQITRFLGLEARFEMLIYLFALGGFIWSLVVTWKLWQKTRNN